MTTLLIHLDNNILQSKQLAFLLKFIAEAFKSCIYKQK